MASQSHVGTKEHHVVENESEDIFDGSTGNEDHIEVEGETETASRSIAVTKVQKTKKILLVNLETGEEHYETENQSVDLIELIDDETKENHIEENEDNEKRTESLPELTRNKTVQSTSPPQLAPDSARHLSNETSQPSSTDNSPSFFQPKAESPSPFCGSPGEDESPGEGDECPGEAEVQAQVGQIIRKNKVASCPTCYKVFLIGDLAVHSSGCESAEEEGFVGMSRGFLCGYCPLLIEEEEEEEHVEKCKEKQERKRSLRSIRTVKEVVNTRVERQESKSSIRTTVKEAEKDQVEKKRSLKRNSSRKLAQSNGKRKRQKRSGTKPHRCKNCEANFATSGELVRHVRRSHTHEKPHRCKYCEAKFTTSWELVRHVRRCHTGERPYQCTHCTYASSDTFELKRHLRIHTGEKPYECDICHKRFTQSNSLKEHRTIHTGDKPTYQCELCPTTCGRKIDLRIHVQRLHTSERSMHCKIKMCGKSFPDKYTLKVHKKTHEGEKQTKKVHVEGKGEKQYS